jgi:hypothetical protein
MQTQEEHDHRVSLRFAECRQEIGTACEEQGADVVERVDEENWHVDQAENEHEHGETSVDDGEQTVEREYEEDFQRRTPDLQEMFVRKSASCEAMLCAVAAASPGT